MPQASGLQFTAHVGELPPDLFAVVGFVLTEGLSERFHGHVQLASTDPSLRARDLLEQSVDPVVWQDSRIFQTQGADAIVRTLVEERDLMNSVFNLKRPPAEESWHYRYQHGSVDGSEQPALILVDRYTPKTFNQTSLSNIEAQKQEVLALWDMLQRFMDVSEPLPFNASTGQSIHG